MMISCLRNSKYFLRNRSFSTLVATEEFPHSITLIPHKPASAIISETILDNGVKLITRDCHSPIVSLKFSILGGSRSELAHQKGAAHFLSVAAYSGNRKNTGLRIIRFLESLGTSIKASSDREKIVYEVSVMADRVEPVVAGVMSAISSPPHATYVLEEAKEIAELAYLSLSTDYNLQLSELLHEAAYGEVSPLGSSRFATSVKKINMDSVLEYRSTNFVSSNLVVTANGISQDKLKSLMTLHGDLLPSGPTTPLPSSPYIGGDVRVRVDLDGSTNLGLAFPVPVGEAGKPYWIISELLSNKFQKDKICASSSVYSYSTGGLLTVTTSGSVSEATRYLQLAVAEIKSIAIQTPSGINGMKNKVSLSKVSSVDSILSSLSAGGREGSGDLRNVSDSSVSVAAQTILKSIPSYAVLGTTAGTPSYVQINKMLAL